MIFDKNMSFVVVIVVVFLLFYCCCVLLVVVVVKKVIICYCLLFQISSTTSTILSTTSTTTSSKGIPPSTRSTTSTSTTNTFSTTTTLRKIIGPSSSTISYTPSSSKPYKVSKEATTPKPIFIRSTTFKYNEAETTISRTEKAKSGYIKQKEVAFNVTKSKVLGNKTRKFVTSTEPIKGTTEKTTWPTWVPFLNSSKTTTNSFVSSTESFNPQIFLPTVNNTLIKNNRNYVLAETNIKELNSTIISFLNLKFNETITQFHKAFNLLNINQKFNQILEILNNLVKNTFFYPSFVYENRTFSDFQVNMSDTKYCPGKLCTLEYIDTPVCFHYLPTANSSCDIPCVWKGCRHEITHGLCPFWNCKEMPVISTLSPLPTTSTPDPPIPIHHETVTFYVVCSFLALFALIVIILAMIICWKNHRLNQLIRYIRQLRQYVGLINLIIQLFAQIQMTELEIDLTTKR